MPSDAVWTGVITGGVGIAGMAAVSVTALRLERSRLRAERERLPQQDDEQQPRERGAAYYRTVSAVVPHVAAAPHLPVVGG